MRALQSNNLDVTSVEDQWDVLQDGHVIAGKATGAHRCPSPWAFSFLTFGKNTFATLTATFQVPREVDLS